MKKMNSNVQSTKKAVNTVLVDVVVVLRLGNLILVSKSQWL